MKNNEVIAGGIILIVGIIGFIYGSMYISSIEAYNVYDLPIATIFIISI